MTVPVIDRWLLEEGSPMSGMTVEETKFREKTGITVLAVRKYGEVKYNPSPDPEQRLAWRKGTC